MTDITAVKNTRFFARIFAFLVLAAIFLMATIKIGDYDIFFHLKAGEHILSTGKINHLDPFSYTTAHLPWPVHSWLSAVVFYIAYSIGGFGGLILFNALVITAAFFVVYLTMRELSENKDELITGAALLLIAAFALRFRMWVRPHVFELVFLALTVYLITLYRSKGNRKLLFILPAVQVLWANMHGSHVLGLVVPAIFLTGGVIDGILKRPVLGPSSPDTKSFAASMALVIAANIIATMINPDTYNTLISSFTILSPTLQNINEFQPLTAQHFMGLQLRYTWGLAALIALGLLGFALNRRRLDASSLLLFFAFLFMSFKGIRYVAEFSIIAGPIVFTNLSGPVYRLYRNRAREAALILAALTVVVVIPLIVTSKTYSFGLGVKERVFPVKAADFIEKSGLDGRMFNSYGFGDYLLWRFYPERKVFIHGHSRSEVFPEDLYKKYLDSHESPEVWKELAEEYGVGYTVLEYYGTDYGGEEAVYHLARNPDWVPIYWDRNAIIYARKTPGNTELIQRYGFRLIRPTYMDFSYLNTFLRRGMVEPVLMELAKLVELSPDNEEAFLARAYVRYGMGGDNLRLAKADLERAIEINPRQAMTHSALGLILLKLGDMEKAEKEFRTALDMDPSDLAAKSGLEKLGR